ncbi:MAG: hypothetical protein AAFY15_00695 [Cyanobacteria bacterium J06648_11]
MNTTPFGEAPRHSDPIASAAKPDPSDRLDRVSEKAQETAQEAYTQSAALAEDAQDVARDFLQDVEARIRKNPVQSAMIAAGAGFVLALLARR